jgi:DNA-binding NarL/FixJ family response regulator
VKSLRKSAAKKEPLHSLLSDAALQLAIGTEVAMRLLLVDNDKLLLDALRVAFGIRHQAFEVQTALDAAGALTAAGATAFDLIILDWWLGEQPAKLCFEQLRDACPGARIVVMSGDDSADTIHSALELGAFGFMRKSATGLDEMREALDVVASGGIYLPGRVSATSGTPPSVRPSWVGRELAACFPQLTKRQLGVLRVLLRGASDKVIARELNIALPTVKSHVQELFRRLEVSCRAEAVAAAARVGAQID